MSWPAACAAVALGVACDDFFGLPNTLDESAATGGVTTAECESLGGGSELLVCNTVECRTPVSPLPHNADAEVCWDPCLDGSFGFAGVIHFESCCDYVEIGGQRHTGYDAQIFGRAGGAVIVRIHTDSSVESRGLSSLVAECDGGEL